MANAECAWEQGRAAFPGVSLDRETFRRHVAEREAASGRDCCHIAELYLACACGHGDAAALRLFEGEFSASIDAAFRRLGLDASTADEAHQRLRERLFMGDAPRRPKILAYSGTGPLAGWVRSTAVRTALNLLALAKHEIPIEDEMLAALAGVGGVDAEAEVLLRVHKQELKATLRATFLGLDRRDRALLRYAFVERLSVDEIGAVFGVHRATAARWVVKAHEALLRRLRAELGDARRRELESTIRLLRSKVDLSLERCFAETRA